MSYKPKKNYKLLGIYISDKPDKKYFALLQDKKTLKRSKMYFGGIKTNGEPYEQYEDKIGYYSKYNHYDKNRRMLYRKRHKKDINKAYSPSWFSLNFLW